MVYNHDSISFLSGLLILVLIVHNPMIQVNASASCTQAVEYLMPCQSFLRGVGGITPTCCQGAQALAKTIVSAGDRKSMCRCLKQVALSVNVNQDNAKELPHLCNIDVPVPIQPNVNCDTIDYVSNRFKNLERVDAWLSTPPGPRN